MKLKNEIKKDSLCIYHGKLSTKIQNYRIKMGCQMIIVIQRFYCLLCDMKQK